MYIVDGNWKGYGPYRDGEEKPKPHRPIYKGAERTNVVAAIAHTLGRGTPTVFRFEGMCRAVLRTRLVLQGFAWHRADGEALEIIAEALALLKAKRPTDLEAKAEFVIPPENCQRCGKELDPEDSAGHRRYCSDVCAKSARSQNAEFFAITENIAKQAAGYLLRKQAIPLRACAHCGTLWSPSTWHARFCSTACARAARGDAVPYRQCDHCGKTYAPPTRTQVSRYCSTECAAAAKRTIMPRACTVCGTMFTPQRDAQTACSRACSRVEPGKLPLKPCVMCGTIFSPKTPWGHYCSPACRKLNEYNVARQKRELKRAAHAQSHCACGGHCNCTGPPTAP